MATTEAALAAVEVVYALRDAHYSRRVLLPAGATVRDVLERSGLLAELPGLAHDMLVGIHGERVTLDHELRDGDRIELYRPLQADPKDTRRRRAAKRKRA